MLKIESVDDLWNFIAYVTLYAPDEFPTEDFLPVDEQMDLGRAFEQLRRGVEIAYPEPSFSEKRAALNGLLDQSYAAFTSGEEAKAAFLLKDFQDGIFKDAA